MYQLSYRIGDQKVSSIFHGTQRHPYPVDINILLNHINNTTIDKLSNKDPNTTKSIYNIQDPYKNNGFTRNDNCWIQGLKNISCFSPAQLSGSSWRQRAGTLITKKHIILAKHFVPSIISGGTPIIFIDDNNNIVTRKLINIISDTPTDISIGLLDEEIPDTIKLAKVLPKNYIDYLGSNQHILAVALDQEEKAIVKVWTGLLTFNIKNADNQTVYTYKYINVVSANASYVKPQLQKYSLFGENIISGDSGNPIFIIIDNELVLLGCWHTPWSGPFVTDRYDEINQMINKLSPKNQYSLTPIDLNTIYRKYC